jgi:aminopeptidase N
VLRAHQFAEDASPMAHPIRPEKVMEMNNFYTLTVYEKGAEVIRMMYTLLGDDGFKKGMALYFERHDGQAVTCDDFVNAMSDASGVDLSLFKAWYRQSGTPVLKASSCYDAATKQYQLTLEQVHSPSPDGKTKENLHITVNFELLNEQGQVLSEQRLLELKSQQQTFTFENIDSAPVPALLGGFSAPVKLEQCLTDEQLLNLMVNASDEFCRWDSGQQLLVNYIKALVAKPELELPQSLIDGFSDLLASASNKETDLALLAEQLSMPVFNELTELIDEVDVDALLQAIKTLKTFIANQLIEQFNQVYQLCYDREPYQQSGEANAKRALADVCLSYLVSVNKVDGEQLVRVRYQQADNMTEQLSALKAANNYDLACLDELMEDFELRWQETTLVMDKWFSLKATHQADSVLDTVEQLLVHPKFSMENPNRARALIGAFSQNPKYFHCLSGKGYQYLTEQLIKLNSINPQVASRLITPLIQYKSFDKVRQRMMRAQLERLNKLDNLSRDLKEKLSAALS